MKLPAREMHTTIGEIKLGLRKSCISSWIMFQRWNKMFSNAVCEIGKISNPWSHFGNFPKSIISTRCFHQVIQPGHVAEGDDDLLPQFTRLYSCSGVGTKYREFSDTLDTNIKAIFVPSTLWESTYINCKM